MPKPHIWLHRFGTPFRLVAQGWILGATAVDPAVPARNYRIVEEPGLARIGGFPAPNYRVEEWVECEPWRTPDSDGPREGPSA